MNVYIALLRGINVSGKNKIKMVELKQLILDLGFKNVQTYIQSGNVIFSSEEQNTSKIEKLIIDEIKKQFNYSVKVLVLQKEELELVFKSNPFIKDNSLDFKKIGITFLKEIPTEEGITKVKTLATKDELVIFENKAAYLYSPNGFGSTKLTNNAIENKLKTTATTRNWNTISKLVTLSNQ